MRPIRLLLLICAFFESGCSTVRYLVQATGGQLALSHHARPIADVLKDPRTSDSVRTALSRVSEFKQFAEASGLKATKNYQQYVDVHRDAAVWVVSACETLAFRSKQWTFPVVGKISYLGWFDRAAADEYATALRRERIAGAESEPMWDVDVRPAQAYSTLGWFRDPVISTMLSSGELSAADLAHTLFHESVHATLYVANQSLFNESVAEFIAEKLTAKFFDSGGFSPTVAEKYASRQKRSLQAMELLSGTFMQLNGLYEQKLIDEEKQARKRSILEEAEHRLRDHGISMRGLNNAVLVQYRTYHSGYGEFERLWQVADRDLRKFLTLLKPLESSRAWGAAMVTDLDSVLRELK